MSEIVQSYTSPRLKRVYIAVLIALSEMVREAQTASSEARKETK